MAKRSTGRGSRVAPARQAQARTQSEEQTEYNPFLKAEHVPTTTSLTMTGWTRRLRGKFGPQIVVEVEDPNGTVYDFAIGVGSPNHRKLFDAFGSDETQWGSGTIRVKAQRGKRSTFVAILDTQDGSANSTARGRANADDEDVPF